MTESSLIALVAGITGGGFLIGLATLIYTSPGKAWRMLVESLEKRVTSLEEERDRNREELQKAETELRRHRMIRSVLENLLRVHAPQILIPDFGDEEHPDVAPERRSSPPVTSVVVDSSNR